MDLQRPEHKMGTHQRSKGRKFTRAAFKRWSGRMKRRKHGDEPSRELRRSW